jgi:Ctf8
VELQGTLSFSPESPSPILLGTISWDEKVPRFPVSLLM